MSGVETVMGVERLQIRALTAESGREVAPPELSALLASLSDSTGPVIWVHAGPDPLVVEALDEMGLDEIVVKSLRDGPERPRVEEFADHVYISLLSPETDAYAASSTLKAGTARPGLRASLPELRELRLFLGPRWIVSVGDIHPADYEELAERMRRQVLSRGRGPSFIAYHICEWSIENLQPLLEQLDDRIDALEDEVVMASGQAAIQELFALKRELVELRRRVSPLRDVMQRLGSHGVPFIDQQAEVYFRDVHDDVMRDIELLDTYRDILSSALDLHLTSVSMRLNRVMKQLAVVATIFMPLSFIVGLFGTNFATMPFESGWWFVGMFVLLAMALVVMLVYARRRT
jgi:magnesium transporter